MKDLQNFTSDLFRNLFDAAPDPILIVNREGTIVLVNRETERQFGYPSEELVGQAIEVLVPQSIREHHVSDRDSYLQNPVVRPMGSGRELFAQKKDGSEFPVEISLSPLEIGGKLFVIGIVRNISERRDSERDLREANRELVRSNKELEEFAYIASHDLQEPLRSVAGACQLLKRRYGASLDEGALEFIDFAVAGAKRMEELINDLLHYSRVSTKAREPSETDLNKVVAEVLDNLNSACTEADATLIVDELPTVPVDAWQFSLLFQNLIGNALKFRGESKPVIEVSAWKQADCWKFTVKDNGIGIDPKYFDRIFAVFKRLHTRDEYPGTGIGLASCKKIVERHGGEIWPESEFGKGTSFHFTLPLEK